MELFIYSLTSDRKILQSCAVNFLHNFLFIYFDSLFFTVINHSWIPFPTKSCLFVPVTVKSSFFIFEFSEYSILKLDFYFISVYIECIWPVFWSSDVYMWLIGKVCDARKDWGQKEREASEDEVVGWQHQCNKHELGQTPGDGERQRPPAPGSVT